MCPEERGHQEPRTLEMRLAAIEDKLAQMSVTEEEMRAYHKVSSLAASRFPAGAPAPIAAPTSHQLTAQPFISCISVDCVRYVPIYRGQSVLDCIQATAAGATA